MDVLKLFYEEPLYLETLSADADPDARRRGTEISAMDALLPADFSERPEPRSEDDFSPDALDRPTPYYRLYLSGANLDDDRNGATAVRQRGAWTSALLAALHAGRWWGLLDGELRDLASEDVVPILADPAGVPVLAVASGEPFAEPMRAIAAKERREAFPDLRTLLEDGVTVLVREPAHDGFDWHIFSPAPIRDAIVGALAEQMGAASNIRAFAIPFRQAQSEHKFYFERWALDDLPTWAEEIHPAGA